MKRILQYLLFIKTKIGSRNFLLFASVIVGVISGFSAVLLKILVKFLHEKLEFYSQQSAIIFSLYFILPIIGVFLTILYIKIFHKGKMEKGLGQIIYSILKKESYLEKEKTYSSIISSSITVGFGGSAGLEAPIVITGAAIGSNVSDYLEFNVQDRMVLLACGAAAGISAIFNAPIAGVLFAIEVLLFEVSAPVFIPLLISTATATILSGVLYSGQIFYFVSNKWYLNAISYYILLGILTGLISVYMKRSTWYFEELFGKKFSLKKSIIGATLLGILILFFPVLYGEGYLTIDALIKGKSLDAFNNSLFTHYFANPWFVIAFVFMAIFLKVIGTSLTIGSGGNGGIFAPSLFTGAMVGYLLSYIVNTFNLGKQLVSENFIVVGMAGVLSGVVHAPLTAIFLIAEITGGYVLLVPLMIVTAISFFITRYFEPYSIYTKHLAEKGELASDKDIHILNNLNISDFIETDFIILLPTDNKKTIINAFSKSNRSLFPIVDENNKFIGTIHQRRIKDLLVSKENIKNITAIDLVNKNAPFIRIYENMEEVMKTLDLLDYWNIPVIDEDGQYLGFVSKSNILGSYRELLRKTSSVNL